MARRDYGSGSIYQRHERRYGCPDPIPTLDPDTGETKPVRPDHDCAARWYGVLDVGWTADGVRDRRTVSSTSKAKVQRRLRQLARDHEDGFDTTLDPRVTVKAYVEKYLEARQQPPKALSPNAWNAAASPLRKWVIPTMGGKRLTAITPGDLRKLAQAHYDAGLKTATADATHRALRTMLNWAKAEGYKIPDTVLMAPRPGMGISDRTDLTLDDALACLEVAAELPNAIRWALALLYGVRQGETLGLVETDPVDGFRCVDFDNKTITLRWQLQDLQLKVKGKPQHGYRIPRDYEAIPLVGMYHLVRPKSRQGYRVLPMIPPIEAALRVWLKQREPNPWGLVFPEPGERSRRAGGLPRNPDADRSEWYAIQQTACVVVDPDDETKIVGMRPGWRGHPSGRRHYYIHECRNFAATQMDEVGASDNVVMSMLGHASAATSRGYMTAHAEPKRQAISSIGERLQLAAREG